MLPDRISSTLSAADITAIKAAITTINSKLPFLIGLTPDEKTTMPKINGNNKIFVEDMVNELNANSALLPAYIDKEAIAKDLQLFEQLDEFVGLITQLAGKCIDTQMLAGSEAYVSSLTAYRLLGAAAKAGLPGAKTSYDKLGLRFKKQGNHKPVEPVAP